MGFDLPNNPLPPHVSESLVRPFPFMFGITTERDPFNDMVAEVHQQPEIFYARHAYPGFTPAWILRRAEDLRTVYFDTEHFSNKDFSPYPKLIGENWSSLPAETDPPMHALYRAFVNPVFTPKAMARLEPAYPRLRYRLHRTLPRHRCVRVHDRIPRSNFRSRCSWN